MNFRQSFYELFNTDSKGETLEEMIENYSKSSRDTKVLAFFSLLRQYGIEKAEKIKGSSLTSAVMVYEHFKAYFLERYQEEFHVVIVDNKNRIIESKLITRGTINKNLVHPREVFAPAIELRAAGIILIHNHPSGDPTPSHQDLHVTKRLKDAGELLGIKIVDHIVIGNGRFYSFVDENQL